MTKKYIWVVLMCVLVLSLMPLLGACDDDDDGKNETVTATVTKTVNSNQSTQSTGTTTNTTTTQIQTGLSGTIDEAGSTSVQPLAELMAKAFMDANPKVKINISGGGSSQGVKQASASTVDIGAASRDLKITENDLIPIAISRDAVAIAVNPVNPVSGLSMGQLVAIYEGEITNWSDVGGPDHEIVVVSREEGSGTRETFEVNVTKNIKDDALFYDSNGTVATNVKQQKYAIGYLSLGYVEGLHVLKVDGVECTLQTCTSGEYPIVRRLYFLTQEIPTGAVKAFLDFCRSEEGSQIALDAGYIPLAK